MVKKSVYFKWLDVEKGAFNKIKEAIAHSPSLKILYFEKDFILYTFVIADFTTPGRSHIYGLPYPSADSLDSMELYYALMFEDHP